MEIKINRSVLFFLLLLLPLGAQAIEFKPKLEAEGRWFYQAEDEEGDAPLLGSVAGTIEAFAGWDDNRKRLVAEFFGRWDDNDDQRSHGDVRELYYQQTADTFEFRLGARRVFWGVTESRHLVDIVNQSDFVENISNEVKLGQPMLDLALIRDLGTFDFILMPYQRERTFPGKDGYPRLPFPVDEREATYQSRDEQTHLDYAFRYTGSFGPLDLGLTWFDGTAREPRLEPCVKRGASGQWIQGSPDGPTCPPEAAILPPPALPPFPTPQQVEAEIRANLVLVPFYDLWRQASLDAQYVIGSMAWKLEAVRRKTLGEVTWGSVAGFEYTFGDVRGSGVDLGVLAEYLYDEKEDALNALVDDEVFAGMRLALNDVAGTQLLAGVIASRDDGKSRRYGLEASGRLSDDWKLSAEARIFSDMPDDGIEAFLEDQDFVTVTLERFF
jgi:hypothetical protein